MFRSRKRRIVLACSIALALAAGLWVGCRGKASQTAPAGRKVLYWVDSMHPQYKSDKPGIAPDCGMPLSPVYADEATATPAVAAAMTTPVDEIGGRKVLYWYDPMAPGSHFDKPGKSPLMDMQLVPKYADEVAPSGTAPAAGTKVDLTPEAVIAAGVKTARVERAKLEHVIRAVGSLEADERKLVHIASRVPGRLDRLYANFTGEFVKKGAPIFEIYSPDLVASQREYLLALENLSRAEKGASPEYFASARSLLEASRDRLRLWGLSDEQLETIARTRQPELRVVYRSPTAGTVIQKNAVAGQYVKEGDDLYLLADLSDVWLWVQVYEYEVGNVKVGQTVQASVTSFPGRQFRGRITFVDPVIDPAVRTGRVRVEVPNGDGSLRPGMFANAELHIDLGKQLMIPKSAVIDTGVRQLAYVRTDPTSFLGREVRLGATAGDRVAVLSGLSEGEEVVTAASFLIDSQSQLATGASVQWGGASEVKVTPGSEVPK